MKTAAGDNKTNLPLEHYSAIYRELAPAEISRRTGLAFDQISSAFSIRILGEEHRALYPRFVLLDSAGNESANAFEQILLLRYLCGGKYFPAGGKRLAYNEIPWGAVYYRSFKGRCLTRCAHAFGKDLDAFKKAIAKNPQLGAEPLDMGDAAYRFEFINGLYISLIIWEADDEFPPSAQILFDDNVVFAFTAEDLAVAGEILASRLQDLLPNSALPLQAIR